MIEATKTTTNQWRRDVKYCGLEWGYIYDVLNRTKYSVDIDSGQWEKKDRTIVIGKSLCTPQRVLGVKAFHFEVHSQSQTTKPINDKCLAYVCRHTCIRCRKKERKKESNKLMEIRLYSYIVTYDNDMQRMIQCKQWPAIMK